MRKTAALAALLASASFAHAAPAADWNLAWSDEFDGPAGAPPDSRKWLAETGDNGWGNDELEYYCAPASTAGPCDPKKPNAAQDGKGSLVIQAIRNSSGTWTSGRFKSLGLAEFKYGRIEARMELPVGAGLWPAFWLLGVDRSSAGWPSCGEIDVMENVPAGVPGGLGPDTIKGTVHGEGYSGVHGLGKNHKLPAGGTVDDGYHVYGALWSKGLVQFYVDDWRKPYYSVAPKDLPKGSAWVFDKPFFLIMNLAVGGSWPKSPSADTPNPAKMLVDYVRVYRR
jgi:beta-glucanase (GH16 family)